MTRPLRRTAALLLLLPILTACGNSTGAPVARLQAPCPRVALLGEAVDLTRHRAGSVPDIGTVEVEARITGFQARCDFASGDGGLDVRLTVAMQALRGPALAGRALDVPVMLAVVERDESAVLSRTAEPVRITFDGNARQASVTSREARIRIPGDAQTAADRTVLIGFVLSPAELAANRRRGVR